MLLSWNRTKTLYLHTLRRLAGDWVTAPEPLDGWRDVELKSNPLAVDVSLVNSARYKVITASSCQEVKDIINSLVGNLQYTEESVRSWYKLVKEDMSLDGYKETALTALSLAMSYALEKLACLFPVCVDYGKLIELFDCDYKVCGLERAQKLCEDAQSFVRGGYLGTTDGLSWCDMKTDYDLLRYLGIKNFEQQYAHFQGGMHIPSNSCVCVDGENITPSIYYENMRITLKFRLDAGNHINVFCSDDQKPYWEFAEGACFNTRVYSVPRPKKNKSSVDFKMLSFMLEKYFKHGVRDFVVMSSDCDFSCLLDSMPEANITFVVRRSCISRKWAWRVREAGIPVCYLEESLSYKNYREYTVCAIESLAQKKFKGITPSEEEWMEFILDTPFAYAKRAASVAYKYIADGFAKNYIVESEIIGCK